MALRISNLRQESHQDRSDLIAAISSRDGDTDVRFQRFSSVEGLESVQPRPDCFLILLLMHAMKTKQDILVEDPVDPHLLFHARGSLQTVLKLCFPELQTVNVEADPRDLRDAITTSDHVATGFSGGVDSMQLINRKIGDPQLPDDYSVSMLMHHKVGSVMRDSLYETNVEHAKRFSGEYGLELAGASCDTAKFFSDYSFLESHSMRTTAATLSLSPVYHRYLFASGTDLQVGLKAMPCRVIDALNPILLPMLRTRENEFSQFGGDSTRLEKMLEVLANHSLTGKINLCVRGSHDNTIFLNCGRCYKCFSFLLVAEAVGRLGLLSKNFDLDAYRNHRARAFTNFFVRSIGPKSMETNRQVAWFLRNHGSSKIPMIARMLLQLVPPPNATSVVGELLTPFE